MKKYGLAVLTLIILLSLGGCGFINQLMPGYDTVDDTNGDLAFDYVIEPGQDTLSLGETWEDEGVTFIIDETSHKIYSDDEIDADAIGEYKLSYTLELEEKTYQVSRKVYVIDDYLPVLSLNPGVDTIKVDDEWEDAGISIDSDFITQSEITVVGSVDSTSVGTYEINYTYENSLGNKISVTRVVTVVK